MSHQSASARIFGQHQSDRFAANDSDPHLVFMLAHQATSRLRFELRALEESASTARDTDLTAYETDIAIGQLEALEGRIRPFTTFIDAAIRFEAQEIIAALDGVRQELERIVDRLEPVRPKGAAEVAARLIARRG